MFFKVTCFSHTVTNIGIRDGKDHMVLDKVPINNLLCIVSHNDLSGNIVPHGEVCTGREDNLHIRQVRSSVSVGRDIDDLYLVRSRKLSVCDS